jgi:hypothetical protein
MKACLNGPVSLVDFAGPNVEPCSLFNQSTPCTQCHMPKKKHHLLEKIDFGPSYPSYFLSWYDSQISVITLAPALSQSV